MINLFVSDIDGCLSEPFRPFDRQRLQELAAYAGAAGPVERESVLPAVSLCSGRAFPYVEALTQVLGLQVPVLFESGGGLYDPISGEVSWHPAFTADIEEAVEEVRRWMIRECIPGTSLAYDYGKRIQAGVAGIDLDEVAACVPVIEAFVARHFPALCVFHTPISIDVLSRSITKREGLLWLAERVGCPVDRMAYIGDTNGDLGALETVGYSFAPANAGKAVKRQVQRVTDGPLIEGVLESYRWCIARNEAQRKKAS
ncbi:MAG: HAD hydrolase family protein [Rhodothermales bacterium]